MSNNGEVKKQKLQRAVIVLTDTPDGKFTAEVKFKPSINDKDAASIERAKKSPSYFVTKRLLDVIVNEFKEKPKKSLIIFPRR